MRDRSAIRALYPQRRGSLAREPLRVYLPFFPLAAVFGWCSTAAFEALLDVDTDTFVILPLLALDAVDMCTLPTGSETFTTPDRPWPFLLSSRDSPWVAPTRVPIFSTPPPCTSVAIRSGPGSLGTALPTGTCSTITWPRETLSRCVRFHA